MEEYDVSVLQFMRSMSSAVTGIQDLHYVPYENDIVTWLNISGQAH
jgi:hypothetical protein